MKYNYLLRFFAVLALLFAGTLTVEGQHNKFIFRKLAGRAVLSRNDGANWLALQEIQPVEVQPGDRINVEGAGRGELMFPDGTVVRIKRNAMITVLRDGIQLKLGYAWFKVRRRSDAFKVFTPLGSCSVLGTSFDVEVDRYGQALVRVFAGIVALRAAEGSSDRQLVLQKGMRSRLNRKNEVAQEPEKFNPETLEASLISEWGDRRLVKDDAEIIKDRDPDKTKGLPPLKPEIEFEYIRDEMSFGPEKKELEEKQQYQTREEPEIIVRQRSGFLKFLREQQLKEGESIGSSQAGVEKDEDYTKELGAQPGSENLLKNQRSLRREYANNRNLLLRIQSKIRQNEMEISAILSRAPLSTSQEKTLSRIQVEQVSLRKEHRALRQKLRDLTNLKR
ncbi:MAG: FecR domain-containing protein [Candidatus Rifleibacteriota bacterium]